MDGQFIRVEFPREEVWWITATIITYARVESAIIPTTNRAWMQHLKRVGRNDLQRTTLKFSWMFSHLKSEGCDPPRKMGGV